MATMSQNLCPNPIHQPRQLDYDFPPNDKGTASILPLEVPMSTMLKSTLTIHFACAFYIAVSTLAFADVTGTVQGRVMIRDNRAASPNSAGLGTLVPARHMVVAVSARS